MDRCGNVKCRWWDGCAVGWCGKDGKPGVDCGDFKHLPLKSKLKPVAKLQLERGVIKPKPKHRLCWWCNRQFRGNHFTTRIIDGHERELHKQCATWHDRGIEPNWETAL